MTSGLSRFALLHGGLTQRLLLFLLCFNCGSLCLLLRDAGCILCCAPHVAELIRRPAAFRIWRQVHFGA